MAAREILTAQTLFDLGTDIPTAGELDITLTAANVSNKEEWVALDGDILIATNRHATDPCTFTITSVADRYGRFGDVTTYSLAAGDIAVVQIPLRLFAQSTGEVHIEASATDVKFAIIRTP